MPRSQSLGNIRSTNDPTKQYYYELDNAMRSRERRNVNPEGQTINSNFKVTHSPQRVQHLDNLYVDSLKQHYNRQQGLLQSYKERETKQREDLKQSLLEQIKQKREAKLQEKYNEHMSPYKTREF